MFKNKKYFKKVSWFVAILFLILNVIAFIHAYKFTHFSYDVVKKTETPEKLSTLQKIKTLAIGIDNPRPKNKSLPTQTFKTELLQSNKQIECWYIKANENLDSTKGTVIIFHGYSGYKSSMLDKSDEFLKLGYNTLLVDFMGSGGSEGNQTTLGFDEAQQVKTAMDYITQQNEKNIYLFGTSMGAVAILKAIQDYTLQPKGIIIECPFGSMYKTTSARFKIMNAPTFPMASLLVFWGGVQNGFWAFGHNPTAYAKAVNCPTLLIYGGVDKNVSRQEIDDIFANLKGKKTLSIYPKAGHENFLKKHKKEWLLDVTTFLNTN